MGLKYWWIVIIWITIWVLLLVWYLLKKTKSHQTGKPVAHTTRLTAMPEYRVALTRYKRLVNISIFLAFTATLFAVLLSARPVRITTIEPAQKGRDIMLCLDVSGSVLRADAALLNRYSQIVNSFEGQRYGLTLFNSSAVPILPFTDDTEYLTSELAAVADAFTAQKGQKFDELTTGTLANFDAGTSLVSDGLASCIGALGDNPLGRSQAILLATDNEANGKPIVSIDQTVALAKSKNVRVYTIDPGSQDDSRADDHAKLRELAGSTGGTSHLLSDQAAIGSIVDSISALEATYAASAPVIAVSDQPKLFTWFLIIFSSLLLISLWRLDI